MAIAMTRPEDWRQFWDSLEVGDAVVILELDVTDTVSTLTKVKAISPTRLIVTTEDGRRWARNRGFEVGTMSCTVLGCPVFNPPTC